MWRRRRRRREREKRIIICRGVDGVVGFEYVFDVDVAVVELIVVIMCAILVVGEADARVFGVAGAGFVIVVSSRVVVEIVLFCGVVLCVVEVELRASLMLLSCSPSCSLTWTLS